VAFFDQLKPAHSNTPKIHIILALSVYHHSQFVRDAALEKNIELYYFPPYSPHLKAIERLRTVMKRAIRNNIFFSLSPIFRDAINGLFDITLPKIAQSLRWRINENSQMIKQVPSS
jgi:transposase